MSNTGEIDCLATQLYISDVIQQCKKYCSENNTNMSIYAVIPNEKNPNFDSDDDFDMWIDISPKSNDVWLMCVDGPIESTLTIKEWTKKFCSLGLAFVHVRDGMGDIVNSINVERE